MEHELSLRPIAEGDFIVRRDGRDIGRIRSAFDHVHNKPLWSWGITVPLPVPAWAAGTANSLDAAKDAFREAWTRFYAGLSEADITLWHRTVDARK